MNECEDDSLAAHVLPPLLVRTMPAVALATEPALQEVGRREDHVRAFEIKVLWSSFFGTLRGLSFLRSVFAR